MSEVSSGLIRDLGSQATPRHKQTLGARRALNLCLCSGFALDRRALTSPDDPYDARMGPIVTDRVARRQAAIVVRPRPTTVAPCCLAPMVVCLAAEGHGKCVGCFLLF